MIEVRLFATFREGRGKIVFMEPDKVSCPQDILDALDIPAEEVSICLINGFHSKLDAQVMDEDVLAIFPPVGGG